MWNAKQVKQLPMVFRYLRYVFNFDLGRATSFNFDLVNEFEAWDWTDCIGYLPITNTSSNNNVNNKSKSPFGLKKVFFSLNFF